jgi:ABC-type dipeptide/oligopeptide/nickel transport system permease subunit
MYRAALPAITLTLVIVAHMMRMTRAALINLLASPYMEMAQLKGVPRREAIVKHALPNAWAPIATVIAFNLAYLVVGVVVVEVVFVYPGIGQLMVDAVSSRDMPVVQACALIFAATYILLNLSADIVSIITNPKIAAPQMTAQAPDIRSVRARRSFFENAKRTLATAPISAWFGMIVIVIYVIAAVFAPLIAPYGEAQVVGKAYQPRGPSSGSAPTRSAATCSPASSMARATRSASPSSRPCCPS